MVKEKVYICIEPTALFMYYTLTDTDFINFKTLSEEEYQLFYGLFYAYIVGNQHSDEDLYNLAVSFTNKYKAAPLRTVKIKGWIEKLKSLESVILDVKKKYSDYQLRFYLPFFSDNQRGVKGLLSSIDFIISIFKEINTNYVEVYDIQPSETFVFPLQDMKFYLTELQAEYQVKAQTYYDVLHKEDNKYWDVYYGIDWELFRRGIEDFFDFDYELDDSFADSYKLYFFQDNFVNTETKDAKKEKESPKELSIKLKTGVLRFMLESFGIRDKEQVRKVAHFVLQHGVTPYSIKTNSNDTIYSYLHDDKKLFKVTNEIKKVLKEYNVDIPEGLETL